MSGKLPGGVWKSQWKAWFKISHTSVKGNCVITGWGGAAHCCGRQWQVLLFYTTNDDALRVHKNNWKKHPSSTAWAELQAQTNACLVLTSWWCWTSWPWWGWRQAANGGAAFRASPCISISKIKPTRSISVGSSQIWAHKGRFSTDNWMIWLVLP